MAQVISLPFESKRLHVESRLTYIFLATFVKKTHEYQLKSSSNIQLMVYAYHFHKVM
jgi:hypothetical protein